MQARICDCSKSLLDKNYGALFHDMTKAEQHWENCLRKSPHNINHSQIFHTFLDTGTPKTLNQCD